MTSDHVDPSVFDRLFDDRPAQPLAPGEFDALQRHAASCRDCRGEFERRRRQAVRGDDVLSAGQVATILNVVRERGREIELTTGDAPVESATPVARASRPGAEPRWTFRLRWGFGIASAIGAACAAFLLLPASNSGRREWQTRGGSASSPDQQLHCYEAASERARPIVEEEPTCDPGRTVTIEARSLSKFGWISVVACDPSGCRLIESERADNRPTVSLFGPVMPDHGTSTIFTVWSKKPILDSEVQETVRTIRSRGGAPDGAKELPFEQATRQLVAKVRAQRAPS